MNKIKVMRVIARLNVGGPAQHVVMLTEGLPRDRFDSLLVYGTIGEGEGDMSYMAGERKLRTVHIPELMRKISPVNDFRAFLRILSIMKKERPVIVHTHTAKGGTFGRIAAIIAGVPVKVHTYHGHVFHSYFGRGVTAFFLAVERVLARYTDRIVAISDSQRDELVGNYRIGSRMKYRVIRLGFEMDRFLKCDALKGRLRSRLGLDKDAVLIGIVGRLVPVKNHEMFIRVAGLLKNYMPAEKYNMVRFVVIGDGPLKQRIRDRAAAAGIEDRTVFAGWMKEMEEAYADLDIVCLTSKNEGTPLSLIEALASGKAVIATDAGGVRDAIGDYGVIVPKDDDECFASRLAGLIADEGARRDMGAKGREYAAGLYSKKNLIEESERMYEELLLMKGITL
ncbi:MAG: glycosyltransferase [Candidatus Omnitrophota bacterium]